RAWWASRSACSATRSGASRSMASAMRAWSARCRSWSSPPVGDFVGERVLEGVLEVGKEPDLVEELRGREARQLGAELGLGRIGNGQEQRRGDVLADDRGGLEQALGLGRQAVDAGGQDGLHGGGDRQLLDGAAEPMGAALAGQRLRFDQGAHTLLQKKRIRFRPLDQQLLERAEGRVRAAERLEQLVGALGRQRIDAQLEGVTLVGTEQAERRVL